MVKEVNNPVTSIWSLQFEFNNVSLEGAKGGGWLGWANNLYFQPVMPVSLTKDWNLITRPVMTLYQSVPQPMATGGIARTTAFGDTILAQVFSPAHTEPWIFGAGPTWIFPTAGSNFTGQGKWQVGPAGGAGYLTNEFMIAALVQQWWSFAGDATRRDTSQMNILPLIYKYFGEGWSVGYSGNILADWKARSRDVWTVPIGLSLGKIVQFGKLPVQIRLGGQYFAVRPEGGPEWNIQLQITPMIPRLIRERCSNDGSGCRMDAAYISALAALGGSTVGALTSLATTWFTLHSQERATRAAREMTRRETLYGQFIEEAAKLYTDALMNEGEDAKKFIGLYALTSKLRLFGSPEVLATTEQLIVQIIKIYEDPKKDFEWAKSSRDPRNMDILRAFSEACRKELVH